MKNGEYASTSKIGEDDLPPLQGVQDTKHFKDLELPILARDAKDWSKTAGITPLKIQGKLEFLEALPDKGRLHILQSVNGRVRKRFHKDTETLEYWVEFEDTLALTAQITRNRLTLSRFNLEPSLEDCAFQVAAKPAVPFKKLW